MKQLFLLSTIAISSILSACVSSNPQMMSCHRPAKGYYCVKSGDTLARISKNLGVPVATLRSLNQLRSDGIVRGQMLRVSTHSDSVITRLQRPSSGFIVRPFGDSNYGVDFVSQRGLPVHAAADGVVLYTGEAVRGYGKLVLIRHNSSLITAYGNNDTILVAPHNVVRTGQTIATVGNSGRSDGLTALHFEVRNNQRAVNPELYFH